MNWQAPHALVLGGGPTCVWPSETSDKWYSDAYQRDNSWISWSSADIFSYCYEFKSRGASSDRSNVKCYDYGTLHAWGWENSAWYHMARKNPKQTGKHFQVRITQHWSIEFWMLLMKMRLGNYYGHTRKFSKSQKPSRLGNMIVRDSTNLIAAVSSTRELRHCKRTGIIFELNPTKKDRQNNRCFRFQQTLPWKVHITENHPLIWLTKPGNGEWILQPLLHPWSISSSLLLWLYHHRGGSKWCSVWNWVPTSRTCPIHVQLVPSELPATTMKKHVILQDPGYCRQNFFQ